MRICGFVLFLFISGLMLQQGFAYTASLALVAVSVILFLFFRARETQVFYVSGVDQVKKTKMQKALNERSDTLDIKLPSTQLQLKGKAQ